MLRAEMISLASLHVILANLYNIIWLCVMVWQRKIHSTTLIILTVKKWHTYWLNDLYRFHFVGRDTKCIQYPRSLKGYYSMKSLEHMDIWLQFSNKTLVETNVHNPTIPAVRSKIPLNCTEFLVFDLFWQFPKCKTSIKCSTTTTGCISGFLYKPPN